MVVAEKSHPKGNVQSSRGRHPDDFSRVAVRISTANRYVLELQERDVLVSQASLVAKRLEVDLADNASQLRKGVRNYVVVMSGSQPGPLQGSCILLRDPNSGKVLVELRSGEVDAPGAEDKIARILDACVTLANEDLAFLRKTSEQLQSAARIGSADLAMLRSIIEKNSYRRCMEAT